MDGSTVCSGCGSLTRIVEHQTRAADEPQTMLLTCPNCPLDPTKIDGSCSPPKLPLRHAVLHTRAMSEIFKGNPVRTFKQVLLRAPISKQCRKDFPTPTENHRISVYGGTELFGTSTKRIEIYQHTGLNVGCSTTEYSKRDLGFGFSLVYVDVTQFESLTGTPRIMNDGYAIRFDLAPGLKSCVYESRGLVHMDVDCGDENWDKVLRAILRRSFCHDSLQTALGTSTVTALRNLSSRAWDHPMVDLPNHLFTAKVDGERSWCVLDHNIAYCFKRGVNKYTWGWFVLSPAVESLSPVVVDVEYCGSHGIFFIDMLTTARGEPASPNRTLAQSLNTFASLGLEKRGLSIRVRNYDHTLALAIARMKKLPYPADGIVAIDKSGTTAKKLKDTRSVELRASTDGNMYTEDGKVALVSFNHGISTETTNIMEVRFTDSKVPGYITVVETFKRLDKANANDSAAFANILASVSKRKPSDDENRRFALIWCNMLRRHLFSTAMAMNPNRTVILNAGAGSGQSIDELSHDGSVAIIHLEPDKQACKSLASRTGYRNVITNPRGLLAIIRGLKTRSVPGCVLNCSLGDLISDEEVCKALVPELKCVLATFSAHFIHEELSHMVLHWNVKLLGCAYVYDNVSVGQHLIKSCGVTMSRVSEDECTVQWGSDRQYFEPYTASQFFSYFSAVKPGVDLIGYPAGSALHVSNSICSKVVVIES